LRKDEETKEQDEDWENDEQHQTENWEENLLADLQAEIEK